MTYSLPAHNTSDPPSISIATLHMWLLCLCKLLIWLKYTQPLYYFYLTLSLLLFSLSPSLLPFFCFATLTSWCLFSFSNGETTKQGERDGDRRILVSRNTSQQQQQCKTGATETALTWDYTVLSSFFVSQWIIFISSGKPWPAHIAASDEKSRSVDCL